MTQVFFLFEKQVLIDRAMTNENKYVYFLIFSSISKLQELISANKNDIYLVCLVHSDEEQQEIENLLENQGLFKNGIDKRVYSFLNLLMRTSNILSLSKNELQKLLFCETDEGKAHIARQLGATCYVDDQPAILQMLNNNVKYLVQIENGVQSSSPGYVYSKNFDLILV